MTVRSARADDVGLIRELVVELADYEQAADQVRTSVDDLHRALFGEQPRVHALIAEDGYGTPVGFALWFLTFSTWEGVHGIYLEDLYVRPAARGQGLGRALLAELAGIAVARGYARVDWQVLAWNTPAIEVYRALGGTAMEDWLPYRLTGEPLARLAATRTGVTG
ncbi:GNAT superfamily N-acetyltransferase [Friedmanniella endophytica]|uniref:GNAT superfamily N-acetyltransferase n=1 Tax=Microlunatus kandeliicorticis TaxID=1759536 RepID=A0A7W3IPV6_9ACTN|nr:GNAT family N-acetyltransferase [Microlunatus kandeliicorticis]MBA8793057.1 GNAT superfamily N-acetyltransferase [Microlunatus kandeliicorticis]